MVICSLVPLIPEYGFACVTVLDVLLRHKSLWQCASWMRTRLGCLLACYLKLWYSFCFSSWRLILGYMEWNCACVMGTSYELLCCSQTSQCFSFSSCNGFLPPSFPREFNLDWDVGKSVLALVHRRRNWKCDCWSSTIWTSVIHLPYLSFLARVGEKQCLILAF